MPQKIEVLVPEATTNLVKNPSFEKDLSGWTSKETENWDEEATFELGATQPLVDTNPTGFDSSIPVWDENAQFETGDLSEFNATVDATAKLSVGAAGAHDAVNGMIIANADVNDAYGIMNIAETSVLYTFWFNPNGMGIGGGSMAINHLRAAGGAGGSAVFITIADGAPYTLQLFASTDGVGAALRDSITITGDWHYIVVFWEASSGVGADDGVLRWFIYDDTGALIRTFSLTNLDTDLMTTTEVRFGTIFSGAVGPTGSYHIDSIYVDVTGAPFPLSIAKMLGNYGCAIPIFSAVAPRGHLADPNNEIVSTSEFRFDPNSVPMGAGDVFDLVRFEGAGGSNGVLEFDFDGTNYRVRWRIREDGGGHQSTAFYNLIDGENKIRMIWGAASGVGDNNGYGMLYLEDILQEGVSGVDNDTTDVDAIIFGTFGSDATTFGLIYLDQCRWANEALEPNPTLATLTQDNMRARFDRFSGKVVTDGDVENEGVFVRTDGIGIQSQVTGSIYVRGEGKLRLRIVDELAGNSHVSKPVTINDKRWHRLQVSGRSGGGDNLRLYIETAERLQAVTFYIDGVQIEAKDVATVYCDGEQQGCRWNGVANLSTSTREATEMTGGRWVPIRDDECEPDTYVTVIGGFGMPPITINRQSTAQTDGSVFDSVKAEERLLQMNIWVKAEGAERQKGLGLERIKELRQILTDLVKPDNSPNSEAFILRVTENNREFTIACRYEAGLEFNTDVRDKWKNSIPLRLLCLDPFWTEDGQEVALLAAGNSIVPDAVEGLRLLARIDGDWVEPFPVQNGSVNGVEEDPDGRIYAGGSFIGDVDGNVIRRFVSSNDDLDLLVERGTGVNGQAFDVKPHPNGKVYVCGVFTADNNGNAMDRIAEYDPTTDVLSPLAGGIDDGVAIRMDIAPNGDVYVVGTFTTVNGAPASSIAFWDGAWQTVGDLTGELGLGAGTQASDLAVVSPTEIYVGISGRLAFWDGSTWTALFTTNNVDNIIIDQNGDIIFGGNSDATTGAVWRWNGSAATQLGEGFTDQGGAVASIDDIKEFADGTIIAVGGFNKIGDRDITNNIALWNGSVWVGLDGTLGVENGGQTVLVTRDQDIYVSFIGINDDETVKIGASTIVTNTGTNDVFPIVTFTGAGKLAWLENQTTGQRVFLNYTLQEDEILTFDFTEGLKVTSNYKGSVPDAVLPNSDDLFLAAGNLNEPKENKIVVFVYDEVDPVVQLRYTPTHWSIDAAAS